MSLVSPLTADLPEEAHLLVGVDLASGQEQWLFDGDTTDPPRFIQRWDLPVLDRASEASNFRVLPFICGELIAPRTRVQPDIHLDGVDVVLDLAHVSVNRTKDGSKYFHRAGFQTAFQKIAPRCGAALAHGHNDNEDAVRCKNNWVVYRGESPFPGGLDVVRLD